jgi:flagellar FliL protein
MALFGKKKAAASAKPEDAEEKTDAPAPEMDEESSVELKKEELAPKAAAKGGNGIIGLVASGLVITLVAAGGGIGLGFKTAASIEKTIADRDAAKPAENHPPTLKYSGDTVVKQIEPVITNLASPSDTWIRLELAMLFKNGAVANPEATAAELRQDVVAYLRTVNLAQLEGPSALQHLREDLNERATLRTGGQVSELIIQTLVVQ